MVTSEKNFQRKSKLSPAKQALLEQRLRGKLTQNSSTTRIPRRQEEGPAPLSSTQFRLWFLDQLQPNSPVYNIPAVLHMEGSLNVSVLEQSINAIIKRHETLHTTFTTVEAQSIQVIAPVLLLNVPVIDLTSLPVDKREHEVGHIASNESLQPFDLQHGPLIRATLLRFSMGEHVLLLTVHHIIADAWSLGIVFTQELVANYIALLNGLPSLLTELPIQYTDFAVWQQQWLQSSHEAQAQISYWKQHLTGAASILELPTDYPRPAIQSFHGASYALEISPILTETLRNLSHKEGVTLFMTLAAAFSTLLYRYTGQTEILIGTPIANRTIPELEHLIGFFANTVVLRTDLADNPSFRELLKRIERETTAAYAHQHLPFEKVVEEIHPQRDLSRSPLFQVMFAHNNTPMQQIKLPELTASILPPTTTTAKFDLTLMTEDAGRGLRGYFEYNTDLFEKGTLARMANHFQRVLEAVVKQPEQRIGLLKLLTEAEQQQILRTWNATATEDEALRYRSFSQQFAEQARQTPDAVAVSDHNQMVTYREIERRTNRLAHALLELEVGSDVLIGLYLERSVELLVSILAVFCAGGAYVPLDPHYPQKRLSYMISDSKIGVLLTLPHLQPTLPAMSIPIISLDASWQSYNRFSDQAPHQHYSEEQLAYVIYTSGSTGLPKGAMVAQKGMLNHLWAKVETLQLGAGDKIAQTASANFDISVWQYLTALLIGGQVCLVHGEQHDPAWLLTYVEQMHITVLEVVPSLLRALLETLEEGQSNQVDPLRHLHWLVATGEALPTDLSTRWLQRKGAAPLVNAYGPTECSDDVSQEIMIVPEKHAHGIVPVGRALANTQLYILNTYLQLVPVGVPGELYVGGHGVGRGYINNVTRTTTAFLPNPFGLSTGERMYKTGDLVAYLSDGRIKYLGRVDQQVKIRGFRIELGEIEAILSQHPQIRDCAVIAREDTPGEKQLVAYVVSVGEEISVTSLKDFLQERILAYMVPTFIFLERLPLTPNGKIDRQALPVPEGNALERSVEYVAARSSLEEQLVQIWSQMLKQERVGIYDNFFELGGHSLKATQVMSRIQQSLGVAVPLRNLFETPTIAGLAQVIEQQSGPEQLSGKLLPYREEERQQALRSYLEGVTEEELSMFLDQIRVENRLQCQPIVVPVSFTQQRMWVLDQMTPGSTSYSMPGGIHLVGSLQVHALERTLYELVARHEILRTIFPSVAGQPLQIILPPVIPTMIVEDMKQLTISDHQLAVQQIRLAEAQQPFDLAHGPLWRPRVLRLNEQEHLVLLTMHHIIFDGWSMGVLLQEFMQLYDAFAQEVPFPLPSLPLQYADFALWQRGWLAGPRMQEQLAYWKQQLQGPLPTLDLPTDHPRPALQTFAGAKIPVALPVSLLQQVQTLSNRVQASLFMSLLAAFKVVLLHYSGQEDIVVGTPIANRTRAELEGLIGCFINTLVLRTRLDEQPSFLQVIERVRQVALEAYAHQDIPFEKLVEELQPERDLSRNPLFQVLFILQNAPQPPLQLRDLTVEMVPTPLDIAKFDLTLALWETPQGIEGELEYNTDLFEQASMQRLLGHFQRVLEAMVAHPEQSIAQIPLLSALERQHVLEAWNTSAHPAPTERGIQELIEAQVRRTPQAPAVCFEGEELSYQHLNEQANRLAHYLQRLGVGPEVLVGIYQKRSLAVVVSVLAVLKAGGAYVPLDPGYPQERLRYMLQDARVPLLLTQSAFGEQLADSTAEIVILDNEQVQEQIQQESTEQVLSEGSATNLAYVIYTSGSTGQPKGVAIAHQSALTLLHWARHTFPSAHLERVLASTSICFDLSVFELFVPLSWGGTVVLVETALHLPTQAAEQPITLINTVPSAISELLRAGHLPATLRTINLAGEPLPRSLVEWLTQQHENVQLYNLYGPTEDTTYSTWALIAPNSTGAVPIGRPIDNTQAYVLDPYLRPVPIGVTGELYLAGAGLARGYLHRPDLTAERFLPNPFAEGERCYRTGDLVRYQADGHLHYLGRNDQQVKVRGYRIELGEIENALRQHPQVKEAVVQALNEDTGGKRLVAYIVPAQAEQWDWSLVRAAVQQRLPEYMVPGMHLLLEQLPQTLNGKVDRRRLPAPEVGQLRVQESYKAARTLLEEQLVEIWQQVLGVERIGIHDNFFELGGHSLKATQIMARVQQSVGIIIPLRNMFETSTIEGLAQVIEQLQEQQQEQTNSPLSSQGRGEGSLEELLGLLEDLPDTDVESLLDNNKSK